MKEAATILRGLAAGAAGLAALAALLAFGERAAHAYPAWQLSSGAVRCNQCHYAPGGGGLITSFARDAAGDELSSFAGNGAFLYGALPLPSWLALGGNFRGAFASNDVQDPNGAATAVFPMQADVYVRVALGAGLSVYASGGVRGQARDPDAIVPTQNYQPISTSRLISREHYLMWQPQAVGPYARAGRFFAPFGLRLAEHVFYVNRDLGFNTLQETYNVSGGYVSDAWELHVTAFAPDFLRHIGSEEKGAAVYGERRLLGDKLAVGAQSRLAWAPGAARWTVGAVGKLYVEPLKTLLLTEVDTVRLFFDDASVGARQQLVAAAGFSVLPVRGLVATMLAERNQVDMAVSGDGWTAASALLGWFPVAHVELQGMGRLQFPGGGVASKLIFLQLHYYL